MEHGIEHAISTSVLGQWGAIGAFFLLGVLAIVWLARTLVKTLQSHDKESKEMLAAQIKANNEGAQALRDVRTSIDVMSRLVDRLVDLRGRRD